MPAQTYPAGLPYPQSAPVQASERRLMTQGDGPRDSRPVQFDRLGQQQLQWTFKFAHAAVFQAWWETDLVEGGAWFVANWPLPQGGDGDRRFVGTPAWQLLPGYGWRVTATCALRGRGLPSYPEGGSGGGGGGIPESAVFFDAFDGIEALELHVPDVAGPMFSWDPPSSITLTGTGLLAGPATLATYGVASGWNFGNPFAEVTEYDVDFTWTSPPAFTHGAYDTYLTLTVSPMGAVPAAASLSLFHSGASPLTLVGPGLGAGVDVSAAYAPSTVYLGQLRVRDAGVSISFMGQESTNVVDMTTAPDANRYPEGIYLNLAGGSALHSLAIVNAGA